MGIRITEGAASFGALAGLQSAAGRLAAAQAKLSSGRQINAPSDDPSGAVRALQLRADLKRNTQYAANATDAIGWMSTADSTYTQMNKLLQNTRTLVVQGLNDGVNSVESRSAIAGQIDALRTAMISLANTSYNGRPLFAGAANVTAAYQENPAYDPNVAGSSSVIYSGDGVDVKRSVGPESDVVINQTGTAAFGDTSTGGDLFTLMASIAAELRTPTGTTGGRLADLDVAIKRVSSAQASEGAAMQRVQVAQAAQDNTKLALSTQLSTIQDIDLAQTAIEVRTADVAYQAALQTTANVRQLSLLNFLR